MLLVNCVLKEIILQWNYRKMTISGAFSYDSFVKLHGKKFGSCNITVLYPKPCSNEVCYKMTAFESNKYFLLREIIIQYSLPVKCFIHVAYKQGCIIK